MDRWERTKIWVSVGSACAVIAGATWFAGMVVSPDYPQRRGYAVEGVPPVDLASAQRSWPVLSAQPGERAELLGYIANIDKAVLPVPAGGAAVVAEPVPDLGTLLAAADPEKGRRAAQVCGSCHTLDNGGPNRVGPNLWAVVGRPVAAHAGFAYSPALSGHGGAWSYQALDQFLAGPARAVPGTKMSFAGLRNPRDRANLLAYLATLGPSRLPFPAPAPAPQAAAPAAKPAPQAGARAPGVPATQTAARTAP
ncbi:cytochrome c family protein [Sphingomonas parva]|uniref:Cytochrome c family protein n=1 Tax=Sphingomonas parva TaxID=2555898 RepID=A0A4Y8ZW89_9SPHN|nr:cytochrome c family protein [Sphingomonas parva]TFI58706.1 cytochrome c family protein [Sphingomonas parva]